MTRPSSTSFDRDGNGILGKTELTKVLHLLKRGHEVRAQHVLLFLSFVDVDDSSTVSFAEFALALKRAQDDFVLKEVSLLCERGACGGGLSVDSTPWHQVLALENLAEEARLLAEEITAGASRQDLLRSRKRRASVATPVARHSKRE